jgi:hypothetical protein
MIIGDDTSGRLPARFVRQVFNKAGIKIPTRYIAASRSVSSTKMPGTYEAYAKDVTEQVGRKPRGLLVTESAGETLGSIRYTHELIRPHCESLDTAIVASRGNPIPELGKVYTGAAIGDEAALHSVWETFEHPLQTRRGQQWSGALTNLERSSDPTRGDAQLTNRTAYRGVAKYCYGRMDTLAAEYATARGELLLPLNQPYVSRLDLAA